MLRGAVSDLAIAENDDKRRPTGRIPATALSFCPQLDVCVPASARPVPERRVDDVTCPLPWPNMHELGFSLLSSLPRSPHPTPMAEPWNLTCSGLAQHAPRIAFVAQTSPAHVLPGALACAPVWDGKAFALNLAPAVLPAHRTLQAAHSPLRQGRYCAQGEVPRRRPGQDRCRQREGEG